MCHGGTLTMFA